MTEEGGNPEPIEEVEGVEEVDGQLDTGRLNPDYFRALVAALEDGAAERDRINQRLRDLRAGAKDRGVNLKALAELLKRRAMDSHTRDNFDEALAIYENVAGLTPGIIQCGELKAQPRALAAPSSKAKQLQEALAWAGVSE